MMKHFKIKLIFVLTSLVVIIAGASANLPSSVKAQLAGYGGTCANNYSDCETAAGSGFGNFLEDLESGTIPFHGVSATGALGANWSFPLQGVTSRFINSWTEERSVGLCYRKSDGTNGINGIIARLEHKGWDQSYDLESLGLSGNSGTNVAVWARACMFDYYPSQSTDRSWSVWGCCPIGYSYRAAKDQVSPWAAINDGQGAGAMSGCCLNPASGSNSNYWEPRNAAGSRCVDGNGNSIWGRSTATNPRTGQTVPTEIASSNVEGDPGNMIRGAGLGTYLTDTYDFAFAEFVAATGAPKVCGNTGDFDCALVEGSTIASGGNEFDILQGDALRDPANETKSCRRCYVDGEAMLIEDAGPMNGNKRQVVFCQAAAPYYRKEELIGTGDITQGYLLEEGDNRELYRQCFETGGIYTAIGCIDPTPTGIITGLIRIALGVMGGVALLQMIYVGLLYQMGNTEKIKGARDQLIATLTGIALLVFSVLILRILGVNILDILPEGSV